MKLLAPFVTFVALSPAVAFANNATDGGMLEVFISQIFSTLLTISLGLALLFLGLTLVFFIKGILDPQYSNKTGRTPVSVGGLIGGILLSSVFASPLVLVDFIGNITGMTSEYGAELCVAPEIDLLNTGYGWVNSSSDCLSDMEENFASLLNYTGEESLDAANLDVYIMGIQTVSLLSMLYAFYILMMHFLGHRDVKISKGMAFWMIIIASTVFAIPNIAVYIDDARQASNRQL